METQHTETVVEKVTAYVKDMLGISPADQTPDVAAKPEYSDIAPALHFDDMAPEVTSRDAMRLEPGEYTRLEPTEVTSKDAMRLESDAYTTKTVGELNAESARREDGEQF